MSPKKRTTGKLRSLKRSAVSAAKADKVKGGAEPVNGKPRPVEPINGLRRG